MADAPVRVAASLWSTPADERMREACRLAAGGIELFHWDYSDGEFTVPGGTHATQAREIATQTRTRSEAHLMVTDPLSHVRHWIDFCDVVAVHLESSTWLAALHAIAEAGVTPALALSPGTAVPDPVPTPAAAVLVMAVQPGFGGSTFDVSAFDTLDLLPAGVLAGVDGGVTASLAALARTHGAHWIVSGTDLVRSPDPRSWLGSVRG